MFYSCMVIIYTKHMGYPLIILLENWPEVLATFVATLIVKITLNVKMFTLRVNNPPLM